jgi:DNA-binding transcriptional MerR regulator
MLSIGAFAQLAQVSPRTLRHYDDLGVLVPARVVAATGYRFYEVGQLGRLHRILALRDLGFGLDQIGPVLDGQPSVEELRGMLVMRRAQIESTVAEEQARLRRVEARLRFLERSNAMSVPDVVIKTTSPITVAETTAVAAGFGPPLGDTFAEAVPRVLEYLGRSGVEPGMMIAWYEEPADDGSVVTHIGFEIGDQDTPTADGITARTLPPIQVASLIHHCGMEDVVPDYEALVQWIDDSGYTLAGRSRELYREFYDDKHPRNVTELQMPITS